MRIASVATIAEYRTGALSRMAMRAIEAETFLGYKELTETELPRVASGEAGAPAR